MNKQLKRFHLYLEYPQKKIKTQKWQWKLKPGDIIIDGEREVEIRPWSDTLPEWRNMGRNYILCWSGYLYSMERRFVKKKVK